jgi:phosphatidylinositol kinase/protein kinase (PI-3  family)
MSEFQPKKDLAEIQSRRSEDDFDAHEKLDELKIKIAAACNKLPRKRHLSTHFDKISSKTTSVKSIITQYILTFYIIFVIMLAESNKSAIQAT